MKKIEDIDKLKQFHQLIPEWTDFRGKMLSWDGDPNITISLGRSTGQLVDAFKGLGRMFYVHDPSETFYERHQDVPNNIFRNAWPYFMVFLILENCILWKQKKPLARLNDSLTSLSHGIIQECGRLLFRGTESAAYIYLFEKFHFVDLNWDSALTWYLALIGVDFCYYWVHRASHEVHLFWAQHQVHHSSEDFNLAVGLRQSLLQGWCSFIFYLPLALVIPPAHFLVHQQFNLLYQFWIHTRVVDSLGPLEYVFNTPKHHRVHHGCNLYCIDRNYGGFLIIWDRLFGTFAAERPKEEIVYGLVFNQPSFNPFFLQIFYNENVVNKWHSMDGWKNKVSAVIKGPSWAPGAPWTGVHEDKIDIRSRDRYDVDIPWWCNVYLAVHFLSVLIGFQVLLQLYLTLNPLVVLLAVSYIIFSLTTIGMLFENRQHAGLLEVVRCLILLAFVQKLPLTSTPLASGLLDAFFAVSAAIWLLQSFKIIEITAKRKKA